MRTKLTPDQKRIRELYKTIALLREDGIAFFNKVFHRHTKPFFLYKRENLSTGYTLNDLYQRTHAAQELGYTVILTADDEGLHTAYAEKLPTVRPWRF